MTKKKKLLICLLVLIAAVLNIFVIYFIKAADANNSEIDLNVGFKTNTLDEYQLFYSDNDEFDEKYSNKSSVQETDVHQNITFKIRAGAKYARLDFGNWPAKIFIDSISVDADGNTNDIALEQIYQCVEQHSIISMEQKEDGLYIDTHEDDPYIVFEVDNSNLIESLQQTINHKNLVLRIILCALIDIVILILVLNIDIVIDSGINVVRDKKLIFNLAKNDFKTKYAGSYFGIIWAFVQPVIMILVYWFALGVGLRSGESMSYPFVLWLMCGLVPWFFFSEALGSGTNALTEYSYLVKKVVFKIDILPIVKLISAMFVHLFFVALIIVLHACYGYYPDLYTIQILYYIICMFIFLMALIYLTSSIVVFFKDLNQIITIILQVGIWATPIMWDASRISPKLDTVMKINPVYYVVNGFRDSLLDKVWFWDRPAWTVCFWTVVIILYIVGRKVFKKLQIHFADVL